MKNVRPKDLWRTRRQKPRSPVVVAGCPGARYNPQTEIIELPNNRKHAFLTFGAQAASNHVDFNTDSEYITKANNSNVGIYKNAVQYGYATHGKNDKKSTEASGVGPAVDPFG